MDQDKLSCADLVHRQARLPFHHKPDVNQKSVIISGIGWWKTEILKKGRLAGAGN
jgi:hypothetical protein